MRVGVLNALVTLIVMLATVSAQNAQHIRLTNTLNALKTEGRLEVEYGNNWWAVCSSGDVKSLGDWACSALNLGSMKTTTTAYGKAASTTSAISSLTCAPGVSVDKCVRKADLSTKCDQLGIVCSAVACVVSDYSTWSACSATCGGGTQQQSRSVTTAPTEGLTCPPLLNTQPCNTIPCATDCVMSDWSDYGNCSLSCGGGVQWRTRTVVTAAQNGGAACPTEVKQAQGCNNQNCGEACQVSDWSIWSDCDRACNGGSHFRLRTVITAQTPGGAPCPSLNDTRACNLVKCPVDCILSDWSTWGTCSKDCGNGTQTQTRYVTNQPGFGGSPCPVLVHQQNCNTQTCPTDCVMSDWTAWSECTKQCGTGSITRTRTIVTPNADGGLPCGDIQEDDPCNTARCPEDRAAILVDRIRKLELQDRINTLEELQAKQAAEIAATQTADLLSQIGGGGAVSSTGSAGSSFIEMLSDFYETRQRQLGTQSSIPSADAAQIKQHQAAVASLQSFKASLDKAKSDLQRLQSKTIDNDISINSDSSANTNSADDEDEVTDEVDAQGHHHKKHHHHRRRRNNDSPSFSETAPATAAQLDPVPPLFAHTVAIPAGNNNDFLSTQESLHKR